MKFFASNIQCLFVDIVSSGLQDQLLNHSVLLPPFTFHGQRSLKIIFQQVPDVLSSVADATQALYPFLTYNKDLVMDVLKKVTNLMQIHPQNFCLR